jgi:GTP-binding protein
VIPVLAIVGRPNVGKSTLFNRLTRSRDAIVAEVPGLTRDRRYGRGRLGGRPCIVVDTGGLELEAEGVVEVMARQTLQAIDEADAVLFVVDGRQGLTAHDQAIAAQLRKTGRPLWVVVNKAEGLSPATANADFHELGLGDPLAISAAHGDGVGELADIVLSQFPESVPAAEEQEEAERRVRFAVIGRPNAGKSTLVNSILGEERMVVYDQPGTTRDSIDVDFERPGRSYTLIDTAGMRRRGRVADVVEKFSVIKTLQAIDEANVAVLVVDAPERVTDQDAHIASAVVEAGRALVVAVNKWDAVRGEEREAVKRAVARVLNFVEFARVHYISALTGAGVPQLLQSVGDAYDAAMSRLSTPRLTRALADATTRQPPPRAGMWRPKMRYAHQGGINPPRIVIHGNSLERVSDSYRRYLERFFRDTFKLEGTPLRVEFRAGKNPYSRRRGGG